MSGPGRRPRHRPCLAADREGNLAYRKTARNFNPVMATAGRITVAEVEHLVQPGEIEPDHIHTPGIFVQRIVRPGIVSKSASSSAPCARAAPTQRRLNQGIATCRGPATRWRAAPPPS